jgi:hypothetical protein
MHPVTPLWITMLTVSANIVVPALVWRAFRKIAQRSAPRLIAPGLVFFAAWVTTALALATRGFFAPSASLAVPHIAWALLPLAAGYVTYLTVRPVREVADRIPLDWMIGVQIYRALGVVFLVEWTLGALPGVFALPAGIGDIAIGVTAPWVAARVRARAPHAQEAAVLWNILGVADLVVAVGTGVLTAPGALHFLSPDAPNVAITMMPLVLVPTIAVPLSILLHLIGLHRLVGRGQPTALGLSRAG